MKDETVDVNATKTSGLEMSPLHLVCHHYFGYEKLRFAKDYKGLELVRDLLLHGANVNARTKDVKKSRRLWDLEPRQDNTWRRGLTPLHLLFDSAEANYVVNQDDFIAIVKLLLDNGADINAKTNNGETPFHYLCKYYQGDKLHFVAKLLIEYGADVNAEDSGWIVGGETPLQKLCCYYKNEDLIHAVKLLIDKGANANTKNKKGDNPLYTVCSNYNKENMLGIVKLLIDNGADVNNNVSWIQRRFENKWRSPLNSLCRFYRHDNLIDIVQLLIQKGADVNAEDPQKQWSIWKDDPYESRNTPLHYLCSNYRRNNLMEIIQLLIKNGARVNAKNDFGYTPLNYLYGNYSSCDIIKKDYLMGLITFLVKMGAKTNRGALYLE